MYQINGRVWFDASASLSSVRFLGWLATLCFWNSVRPQSSWLVP